MSGGRAATLTDPERVVSCPECGARAGAACPGVRPHVARIRWYGRERKISTVREVLERHISPSGQGDMLGIIAVAIVDALAAENAALIDKARKK